MDVTVTIPTHCSPSHRFPPETIRHWVRRADDADLPGLWVVDHLTETPNHRTNFLDPLMTLGHASSVAPDLDLGTSILLLPLRNPVVVAAEVATLQHLTDGTLRLGLGAGYVDKEFEAVGVPKRERGPRLSEGIEVLQGLFEGTFSFEGRFHSFEDVRIDPVPDEPPELYAGGNSVTDDDADERHIPDPILDRILATDGWISAPSGPRWARAENEILDEYARANGRDPDDITRILFTYGHLVEGDDRETVLDEQRAVFGDYFSDSRGWESAERHNLVGTIAEVHGRLDEYEEMGFDEVVVAPPSHEPDRLDRQMDLFVDHLRPRSD